MIALVLLCVYHTKHKMKKVLSVIILIALVFALFSGCGGSNSGDATETPNGNETSTGNQEETNSNEKFNFTVSTMEGDGDSTCFAPFRDALDRITERTNGNITFTIHYNNSLGSPPDQLEMVKTGAIDILMLGATMTADTDFPVSQVVTLPFYCTSATQVSEIIYALHDAGLLDEYEGDTHLLMLQPTDMNYVMLAKSEITSLEGFKGKLIRVNGNLAVNAVEALGGSPATITSSELYSSLERGVVDGAVTAITNMHNSLLYETCSYLFDVPIMGGLQYEIMNMNSWNSLPDDYKAIFEEEMLNVRAEHLAWCESAEAELKDKMDGLGMKKISVSNEVVQELRDAMSVVMSDYKDWLGGLGYDVEAVFAVSDSYIN